MLYFLLRRRRRSYCSPRWRLSPPGARLTTNQGAHDFSEIIYAYTTSMANNGQNLAGLSANTPFYNSTTALALAGHFAQQQRRPVTTGTMPPTRRCSPPC